MRIRFTGIPTPAATTDTSAHWFFYDRFPRSLNIIRHKTPQSTTIEMLLNTLAIRCLRIFIRLCTGVQKYTVQFEYATLCVYT